MKAEATRGHGGFRTASKALCFLSGLFVALLIHTAFDIASLQNIYPIVIDSIALAPIRDEGRTLTATSSGPMLQKMVKYVNTYKYSYSPQAAPISLPASECGESPDFTDFFGLSLKLRSRFDEDKIVYKTLFKNKMNGIETGTYVEIGAFDGRGESNSAFFDLCLGWKGLLIEGNPVKYAELVKNRPHAHKMSFAPSCNAQYEAINKTVEFYPKIWTNAGLSGSANAYEGEKTVSVPCGPFGPILQDVFEEEQRIMFFSLDVEGAELMVLDTINFDKIIIEVMMIEVENTYCQNVCKARDMVRAKMTALGYQRYEGVVRASDIHIHPQSRFQMPASAKKAA